ncbi:Rv1733c family protein [Streptomyces thermoalcalitolerans]|uniref:Integral membrane protein n=1 Tax=Streptomyces thermoalcalitolerans TaxID=65605 RepID=A0ABN1NK09_9ACTN
MSGGKGTECARRRLWRWRDNPLRRREDVVEAWIVLVMLVVAVLGGALVGTVATRAIDQDLARQRADRHPVQAVLLTDTPSSTPANSPRLTAMVRWTAPDGTVQTGRAPVDEGLRAGTTITVWQDDRGVLVPPPPDPTEARVEAVLLGCAAALAFVGVTYAATALARRRLDRRRYDRWAAEWALIGPLLDRRTS